MRRRPLARVAASLAVSATAVLVMSAPAGADAVYHSAHISFHAVQDVPLRSGFLENIHASGPNVFAHELYVVNGALPNTAFEVSIAVSLGDPTCTATPSAFPTATLQTNAAGNGTADIFFTAEGAAFLRHATHGAIWTLSAGGVRRTRPTAPRSSWTERHRAVAGRSIRLAGPVPILALPTGATGIVRT